MNTKVIGLEEAAALVPSGASVSIGGFTSQRHPSALLRALVRKGVRDLTIYYHSAGSDVDLLIGAGCVRRLEGAYLADGVFAPIAPNFRRHVQQGRLEVEDYSPPIRGISAINQPRAKDGTPAVSGQVEC